MKKWMVCAGVFLVVLGANPLLCGEALHGKGLKHPTKQELRHLAESRIHAVLPNKIGASRMNMEWTGADREFVKSKAGFNPFAEMLPKAVDNSKLPSFPPIGNQGQIGSCVAWASTYYQATHELGLLRGFNNKMSKAHVLSPKWTYNMINFGQDGGAYIIDGYMVLSQNGAATWEQFPYDNNYLAWDTNPQDWVSAISNRTTRVVGIKGVNGNPQDLTHIKQALANGHLLTFGTFIESWVMAPIQPNPATQNLYVGEWACSWMNGESGGHLMTVVGYDDRIWIDINGNGQVDPGEMGAFLVANSWGTSWGNRGFIWISYDAFLKNSAVANGPSLNRVEAAAPTDSMFLSINAKAAQYTPSLIAQFELGQTERNQIKIAAGVSDLNRTTPFRYFLSGAVSYQGGAFEFDGTNGNCVEKGVFAMDLTDLIVPGHSSQRFYFMVADNISKTPTTVQSLSLIDLKNGKTIPVLQTPTQLDNGKITEHIDYQFVSSQAQASIENLSAQLTSVQMLETVKGVVPLFVSTTGPVESVDFYVDSNLMWTDHSMPYLYSFDSRGHSNGIHDLFVIARGNGKQTISKNVKIRVKNFP